MKDKVKYGHELLDIEIPEGTDLSILLPKQHPTGVRSEEIVEDALAHPIGARLLAEEIHAGDTVCILTNDITRLTRSHIYIPILVRELNKAGVPDGDITILFANGMHSAMTEEQMCSLITEDIYRRVTVVQHDCEESPCQLVGTTSYGHEVWANKIAMAADKLILTGGILVHHMAGFGGGRKDIIPGCARKDTILSNHKMVIDPNAQAGVLENNPVHLDFMEACAFTHPAYLLNVICDDHGMIYQAVAGHWREAYLHGAELAKDFYLYPIPERPDIVIASCGGFPKDIDLRQSKKGFYNASRAVKKGGVMASSSVGGLSGAFIPVSEDEGMIAAASSGALTLDKLEAMTCVCSVGLDMIALPGDTSAETIAAIIADEAAIGMINTKTTAVRVIPAPGCKVGDTVEFGGLLGSAPVQAVHPYSSAEFIARGGRIPAPLHSLKN